MLWMKSFHFICKGKFYFSLIIFGHLVFKPSEKEKLNTSPQHLLGDCNFFLLDFLLHMFVILQIRLFRRCILNFGTSQRGHALN